jgi:hypothetical protein
MAGKKACFDATLAFHAAIAATTAPNTRYCRITAIKSTQYQPISRRGDAAGDPGVIANFGNGDVGVDIIG